MWLWFILALVFFAQAFFLLKRRKQSQTRTKSLHRDPMLHSTRHSVQLSVPDSDAALGLESETVIATATQEDEHATEAVITNDTSAPSDSKNTPDIPSVVLYVMAPKGAHYGGYELLQTIQSQQFQYGKSLIFHRYNNVDNTNEILFHLASAQAPGTFDLSTIGEFTTPGLCLFFTPKQGVSASTFECLLNVIDQLVEDLGGDVFDEQHVLLTAQKMAVIREQLHRFDHQHEPEMSKQKTVEMA